MALNEIVVSVRMPALTNGPSAGSETFAVPLRLLVITKPGNACESTENVRAKPPAPPPGAIVALADESSCRLDGALPVNETNPSVATVDPFVPAAKVAGIDDEKSGAGGFALTF